MFVAPDQRGSWSPPPPKDRRSRRSEDILLFLVCVFLLSLLLGPIAGGTVLQAVLALFRG